MAESRIINYSCYEKEVKTTRLQIQTGWSPFSYKSDAVQCSGNIIAITPLWNSSGNDCFIPMINLGDRTQFWVMGTTSTYDVSFTVIYE